MIDRRVAETGDHDGVGIPFALDSQAGRSFDRERHSDCSGQMRRNGRRLRNDGAIGVAEYLVATPSYGLVSRGANAEQHVADGIGARGAPLLGGLLVAAGNVERARPVVQEGRVGGTQRGGDGGVPFVAARADGVEPLITGAELASAQVYQATRHLGVEQLEAHASGEGRAFSHRSVRVASLPRRRPAGYHLHEVGIDGLSRHRGRCGRRRSAASIRAQGGGRSRARPSGRPSAPFAAGPNSPSSWPASV